MTVIGLSPILKVGWMPAPLTCQSKKLTSTAMQVNLIGGIILFEQTAPPDITSTEVLKDIEGLVPMK